MRSTWLGKGAFMALVLSVTGSSGLIAGCAEERDPINRVQSGALPKSFFLGPDLEDHRDDPEFRTKTFNIDSAANTDNYAGTIGGASGVDRVRFEVTEKFLLVRRSYQEAPGSDNRGLPRVEVSPGKWEFPTKPDGTIIAAYRIQSHFDVRRGYNSSTGEEMNTVEENASDRPWHQREYMRVDWSTNLAESTHGDISWVFGEGLRVTPVEYYASSESENNEDRPHFETENGYFDITNKYQLSPEIVPWFGVPECVIIGFFNGTTSFDCTPTEVKVRSSYVKLTGAEDYEPFEESYASRDVVGNWGNAGNSFMRSYGGAPLTSWDPQYGYTDENTKTFYSVLNIWEKSHLDVACNSNHDGDPEEGIAPDGTADQCEYEITGYEGSYGSQCDVHVGKCTIPVRDRSVKPIGFWLNADAPAELQDQVDADGNITERGAVEEVTQTWNQLLKVAVATRREVECRRTRDGTREECHEDFFEPGETEMVAFGGWGIPKVRDLDVDKGAPVLTTCHNPVRSYDPEICGKPGEVIRLGDVRKNYQIYWPYASRAPYGGVGSIGGDPLTGEMIGVTATTMMRSASFAAAQQRDIIQLALGDITLDDLISGAQATRYAHMVKNGRVVGDEAFVRGKTDEEIAAAVNKLDIEGIRAALGISAQALESMSPIQRSLQTAEIARTSSPQAQGVARENARFDALLSKLDATEYKADIANRGLHRLLASSQDSSSGVYQAIRTFAANDSSTIQDVLDRYNAYLGNKGVCFHDSLNTAGAGSIYQPSLAPYFKSLYGDLTKEERGLRIYQDLLREAAKGIHLHELGHAIGLRHNFASSWDSQNYLPQYWQLRTNNGQSTGPCTAAREPGSPDTCMGPRYLDPPTDDELGLLPNEPRPGIEYFANTSTMEYQIERFGETAGAGLYDLHAMKTLYGRSLETFDPEVTRDPSHFGVKTLSHTISGDLILNARNGLGLHYTRAAVKANLFNAERDCRPATEEEKEVAKWRIVHGKVCSPPPKNHLAYEDMLSGPIELKIGRQTAPVGANGVRWKGVDENGRELYRWPYRYGEDYSRAGYLHAKLSDSGADVYEITMNTIKRYEATYPWTYFRRQNKEFAWWSLPNAVANSTFARLRGYHWNTTTHIGRASAADLRDDDGELPSVIASAEMFDFLQRVILTPEPGEYETTIRTPSRAGALKVWDLASFGDPLDGSGPIGSLGLVDGRFVQIDFDNDRGGSWDYQHFPTRTGFDEEKVLALRELVDSRPTLSTVSRDNALDGRDPYISFRTDTPHALDRLIGGILAEDWETIGPSMNADGKTHTVFSLLEKDATQLARPAGNKGIIFPNVGYANALGTGIYSMLFSRFSTDMTLASKMRIRFEGDIGFKIPDERLVAFTDPITGHRYLATSFGTETILGRAVDKGIASRMLQRANEILAATYKVTAGPNQYGEYEVELDAAGSPVLNSGVSNEQQLRRYIGLLDAMRQVGNILGGGPIGYGEGGG